MIRADDLLHGRTPDVTASARFDQRSSPTVLEALAASFCPLDGDANRGSVLALSSLYRDQITAPRQRFAPARPLANDLAALDILRDI